MTLINESLTSHCEQQALIAQSLPAFSRINLQGIKNSISVLLGLIGRGHIFEEYTIHNISHINRMLEIADWIIDDGTKPNLTPADYMMITLSVYFHDLGMLVTEHEFDNRRYSEFPAFFDSFLNSGEDAEDYKANLIKLYPDQEERERYVYQEYVRQNHARRIKAWIEQDGTKDYGFCDQQVLEVARLLEALPDNVRNDVALLCESHHLSDISDTNVFEVSRPYGHTKNEFANIQYVAIVLRTVDLLHISGDRAPTVLLRLIDPKNPFSKREWLKQSAVTSIRGKILTQDEKSAGKKMDTIEIRAEFSDPEAYFDLQKYINYAKREIEQCHDWVKRSKEEYGLEINYHWRYVDTSKISAKGFYPRQLNFTLDQGKILKLLTGQTLYNDISVSLREILQNSLDATRLREHQLKGKDEYEATIHINWNDESGVLEIIDNGVGMSQMEIENYFLKAGISKYQTNEFRKSFPNFTSIGRFGIGVLSCFMISDAVEVFTTTGKGDKVRDLKLSDAQSDYLVRDIDRNLELSSKLPDSGTIIQLLIRPSMRSKDFRQLIQRWVMFPSAEIIFNFKSESQRLGFRSVEEAVSHIISSKGYNVVSNDLPETDLSHGDMRVISSNVDGLEIAFATSWNKWAKDWEFVSYQNRHQNDEVTLGTYIEGIYVVGGTPGYRNNVFIALANFTGKSAPRTNVARSDFEVSPELDNSLSKIYNAYCRHIENEVNAQTQIRQATLTQAATDARTLMGQLAESSTVPVQPLRSDILKRSLRGIKGLIVDDGLERKLLSINDVSSRDEIWTVAWDLVNSVDYLSKHLHNNYSAARILQSLGDFPSLPDTIVPTLYLKDNGKIISLLSGREISKIVIHPGIERVDFAWSKKTDGNNWFGLTEAALRRVMSLSARLGGIRNPSTGVLVLQNECNIEVQGGNNEKVIVTDDYLYFIKDSEIANHVKELLRSIEDGVTDSDILSEYIILDSYINILHDDYTALTQKEISERLLRRITYSDTREVSHRIKKCLNDLGNNVLYIGRRGKSSTRVFVNDW